MHWKQLLNKYTKSQKVNIVKGDLNVKVIYQEEKDLEGSDGLGLRNKKGGK